MKVVDQMNMLNVHLLQLCSKKIRDGAFTYFWIYLCLGGMVLKNQFTRIYNLENSKDITAKEK